jgi:lipoic acid synthetase
VARIIPLTPREERLPKPEWLKVRAPGSPGFLRLKSLMRDLNLHTVCEDARCPNIGECWHHGTATFMILGDVCTRACAYCAVTHGRPGAVDTANPRDGGGIHSQPRLVVTSVIATISPDGGASIFARNIRQSIARLPECQIEVLIPDFQATRRRRSTRYSTPVPTRPQHRNRSA